MQRRQFLASALTTAAVSHVRSPTSFAAETSSDPPEGPSTPVPLGLDGHSLRGMRWKAMQLIEFAGQQKLDAVLLNGLHYFESLDTDHLRKIKTQLDQYHLRLYCGAGAIAKNGKQFKDKWGTAEEMLEKAISVATILGSPVVNVRIGSIDDRFLEGGIQPRIDEAIRVLKASSTKARDAGVKFGFENHAADLRSEELLQLVEEVGTEVCGVMLDPGNGLWAMEDPMQHLQRLAPCTVCNSIRDYQVWASEEGATFQWMAMGDGLMDVSRYVRILANANPAMPIFVESISNSARPIPYLRDDYWKAYPNLKASGIVDFLKLVRSGTPATVDFPERDQPQKEFDQQHQRQEFLKSIAYLKQHCNAGINSKG